MRKFIAILMSLMALITISCKDKYICTLLGIESDDGPMNLEQIYVNSDSLYSISAINGRISFGSTYKKDHISELHVPSFNSLEEIGWPYKHVDSITVKWFNFAKQKFYRATIQLSDFARMRKKWIDNPCNKDKSLSDDVVVLTLGFLFTSSDRVELWFSNMDAMENADLLGTAQGVPYDADVQKYVGETELLQEKGCIPTQDEM